MLTDFLPVDLARGLGSFALSAIGPLRRAALREGILPEQPRAPGAPPDALRDSRARRLAPARAVLEPLLIGKVGHLSRNMLGKSWSMGLIGKVDQLFRNML